MNQPAEGETAVPTVAGAGNALPPDQTEPQPPIAPVRAGTQPQPERAATVAQAAGPRLPDPSKANTGWWVFVILLLAVAVVWSFVAARGPAFSHAHRLSAAGAALLDMVTLATLAHVILLRYQRGITSGPTAGRGQKTLIDRRRGLKAAVIGQDGRASTSKAQVVLWTGAMVWALTDLLLLARAYPGGNLFTGAVTSNWRPEYLVLLGLPVAAAATAKAVVSGSNAGKGPVKSSHPAAKPRPQATRVMYAIRFRPG
jgi:hypothetical protein